MDKSDNTVPQAANTANDRGFFTEAEWRIYKHLLARYKSTHEREFVATDTYFKALGLDRRTTTRAFAKFRKFGMLKISRDKKQGQKYGARKITLYDVFFNPLSTPVELNACRMKDRKILQMGKKIHQQSERISHLEGVIERLFGINKLNYGLLEDALADVRTIGKQNKEINKEINNYINF